MGREARDSTQVDGKEKVFRDMNEKGTIDNVDEEKLILSQYTAIVHAERDWLLDTHDGVHHELA